MKKVTLLLIALLVLVVLFSCARKEEAAEGPVKIIVASDCTWPPMEFLNADKEIIGYDIDLMNAIAEKGGFQVEIRNTAWDGIFAGLANKDYDAVISSVTITDERKETMDFSMPYINAGQVLIVQQATQGITTLADMKGKSAGAQIGTTGAIEVQNTPGVTLRTYDELGLAIEDLVNGRLDGVVADTPIAANFVLQNDAYKGKLKIVGEPFTDEYYGIAVKKGNTEVLDLINKGLKAVLDAGINEELQDKWLR
jgi:polar amino acid transport system substrate-binding protein